jgi:Peptidase family M1 domain
VLATSAKLQLAVALAICLRVLPCCAAQTAPAGPLKPQTAESLYLQLGSVELDPARVFRVRGASIDRASVHITLEDGTIGFTKDVMGRITGAFFEGDGEVLLPPPSEVERKSMSLFTGMAILEERFSTAYFRFNDNTAGELQSGFRAPDDAKEFVARWNETVRNLAGNDAMRLLATFSDSLPVHGKVADPVPGQVKRDDHMLHARLQGNTLGIFDILFDSTAGEQVEAGQSKATAEGVVYYDVWTSFSTAESNGHSLSDKSRALPTEDLPREESIVAESYVIDAHVKPPKELDAKVQMRLQVKEKQARFLAFELSRYLKVQSVEWNGQPVEFIQNPAIEGTRLERSGNDVVAVVLPEPVKKGQEFTLDFVYGGEVLADAGKGLLYVGARGNWYPNRGISMSNFDLTFHYPQGWTLLATGRPQPSANPPNAAQSGNQEQTTHWISDRPIPVAGFDLGKYVEAAAQAGNVTIEAYATTGVERDFLSPQTATAPLPGSTEPFPATPRPSQLGSASKPSPARNAMAVAQRTAQAIVYYSNWFGPYPYSQLDLTQLPGTESQGWPGLVFLSSYAYLTREEQHELHIGAVQGLIDDQIPAHEAAHQWWGDLVTWSTYRDQWFSEGLANYSALMILQEKDPASFRQIMEKYRQDLVAKDKNGDMPKDDGPVTLGTRLLSSRFPTGYEAISYGRGTWLFHMLRSMMQDAALSSAGKNPSPNAGEEPFMRSLRKLRERYQGKPITTRELLSVFAENLPPTLRYEGKSSLDWFLDSWVNGTSLPKIEMQNVKFSPKPGGLLATGVIRQKGEADTLVTSVPIYAVAPGKSPVLLGRVFADGPETAFHFSAPPGTHKLLLDPNETVLTSPK